MESILRRAPGRQDVFYVFGGAVFAVFSWSVAGFLHELSSWVLYYQALELFGIFCYLMAFALLESLAVTAFLLLTAMILPQGWFRNGFAYKGFLTLIVAAAAAIKIQSYPTYTIPGPNVLLGGAGIAILVLVFLILLTQHIVPVQKFVVLLLDRLQVFAYLYVPIGLLGLLVVFLRNLIA